MQIKVNTRMPGFAAGEIISVPDVKGVPTDAFWRRRLEDSAIDNCCEVVSDVKTNKPEVSNGN